MKEKFCFSLVILIFFFFFQGKAYSQWNNISPFPPSIGYELPFAGIPPIGPDFSFQSNPLYQFNEPFLPGGISPAYQRFPLSTQYPFNNPFPGNNPFPAFPDGFSNGLFAWGNNSPSGPGYNNFFGNTGTWGNNSPSGPGYNNFFGNTGNINGFFPNVSYNNSNPLLPPSPYPFYLPYNFYPTPPRPDEESESEESESDLEEMLSNAEGIWIGTWTSTFDSSDQTWSNSASINLAQQENSISGVFLFVGNEVINNLSAIGTIEGNEIVMTTSSGQDESKKTIDFEGEVNGNTLIGKFVIENETKAVVQIGEVILTRI